SSRWRSEPQMAVDVIRTITSPASAILGSGTVSTRTSLVPCQQTAFIVLPVCRRYRPVAPRRRGRGAARSSFVTSRLQGGGRGELAGAEHVQGGHAGHGEGGQAGALAPLGAVFEHGHPERAKV